MKNNKNFFKDLHDKLVPRSHGNIDMLDDYVYLSLRALLYDMLNEDIGEFSYNIKTYERQYFS